MNGIITSFDTNGNEAFGIIEATNGKEFTFRNPNLYVKNGFRVEFEDKYDDAGNPYADNIKKQEFEYPNLSKDILDKIISSVSLVLDNNGFILGTSFPDLLRSHGIDNIREYAPNVKGFIEKYLSDIAEMRSTVIINGKAKPGVIVKKNSESNLEFVVEEPNKVISKELDNEIIQNVICIINEYLSHKSFLNGTELPRLLRDVGVADFHEYAKNIFDFVDCLNTSDFYAIANALVNGKRQACIITKKLSAVNPLNQLETTNILDDSHREAAACAINDAIEKKGFIVGSNFNRVLQTTGIEDFKTYSPTIERFIFDYFSDRFSVRKDEIINVKKYPCIIVLSDYKSTNTDVYNSLMDESYQQIHATICDVIGREGFISDDQLDSILAQFDIPNYKKYAYNVQDFITRFFGNELCVLTDVIICGKKHPCIIAYIGFDVDAYQINELVNTVRSTIDTEGFMDLSNLMDLIKSYRFEIAQYASGLTSFLDTYLKDVILQKNRVVDKTIHTRILIYQGCNKYCSIDEYNGDLLLEDSIINNVVKTINKLISPNGYIQSIEAVDAIEKCGVQSIKYYADSFSNFLNKYGMPFSVKRKVYIDGTEYSSIVIRSSDKDRFVYFCEDNHNKLNELFDSGKYMEFICSPLFKNYRPTEIPLVWLEKGLTCAKRILTNNENSTVCLNNFQKELILSVKGFDFQKHHKQQGKHSREMIEECADTFLPKRRDNGRGLVVKALNNISDRNIAGNSLNSDYKGLMKRTEACWNELYPLFSLIYIIQHPSQADNTIKELCTVIKSSSKINPAPNAIGRWLYLPQMIEILYRFHILEIIPEIMQTMLFGTFLDYDALEELSPISQLFSDKNIVFMLKLLNNYKELSEHEFKEAFLNSISRELFQKISIRIWNNEITTETLPLKYLLLLSYIIKYDMIQSVDEIIFTASNSKKTVDNKKQSLVYSLDTIIDNMGDFPSLFDLGEYADALIDTVKNSEIAEKMKDYHSKWLAASRKYFECKTLGVIPVTNETSSQMLALFDDFESNTEFEMILQVAYANWYFSTIDSLNLVERLTSLTNSHAYLAVCNIVESLNEEQHNKDILHYYIDALMYLNKLDKALFVAAKQLFDEDQVINVITKICIRYGVSETTFNLITSCFSIHEAIERLMVRQARQAGTNNMVNVSIIVLLSLDGKPLHVYYMYNAFGDKVTKGYARILSQIMRWSSNTYKYLNLSSLHYKNQPSGRYTIIDKSFDFLPPEGIISLISWCRRLRVPGFGDSIAKKQTHSLSSLYDRLLSPDCNATDLIWFYDRLLIRTDINSWKLCVTASIIQMLSDEIPSDEYEKIDYSKIEGYLNWMISSTSDKDFPVNFLIILNSFFDKINSSKILHQISEKIDNDEVRRRIFDSKLNNSTSDVISELKEKCLFRFNNTGKSEFLEIAKAINSDFSLLDSMNYSEIIKHDDGKLFVLKELCSAYIDNECICNVRNKLAIISSQKTNYPIMKMIEAVKFIYSESSEYDELVNMIASPDILDRVRRSVAKILSVYPSKKALFSFENGTFSEKIKLMVYSVVSGVVFDQELYKQYFDIPYEKAEADYLLDVHAYFQYKLYLNQVYHNADRPFLYIERRFIKAIIARALIELNNQELSNCKDKEIDDTEIISVMRKLGHYDNCFDENYDPFKKELMQFFMSESLSNKQKKLLIYVLLSDNWRVFPNYIGDGIFTSNELAASRAVIGMIAQRESSAGIYQFFFDNINNQKSRSIVSASQYISLTVYEALNVLINDSDNELLEIFADMMNTVENLYKKSRYYSFGSFIKYIMELDESIFVKYKDFFIPFMVSIQFKISLYDYLYDQLVIGEKSETYLSIFDYISKTDSKASVIKSFFCSVISAMRGDKIDSKRYFNKTDFDSILPKSWEPLVNDLNNYLVSDIITKYVPIRRTGDSSERQSISIQVPFVKQLSLFFNTEPDKGITSDELKSMKRTFEMISHNDNVTESDKIKTGLAYLVNLKEIKTSEDKTIAYQVASFILLSSVDIKPIDRLITLNDAFILAQDMNFGRFSEWCIPVLKSILKDIISLIDWCKYADLITNIAQSDSSCNKEEIDKIIDVLNNISVLLSPTYPLDLQLSELEKTNVIGFINCEYASYLQISIDERIHTLKKKNQLRVSIVNIDNCSSDRFIYGMIENTGHHTVVLGDGNDGTAVLSVCFNDSQNEISIRKEYFHIRELQSRCLSGFAVPIPMSYSENSIKVTISIRIGSELYSQSNRIISIVNNIDTLVLKPQEEWYTVSEAVADSEILFGREDKKDSLRDSIDGNLTVLYGPSRIGKTSLMNWIKTGLCEEVAEKKGKRIITISIAPEGSARENDYDSHFAKEDYSLDYTNDRSISEYLLIDSIVYGLKMPLRLTVSDHQRISADFIKEVSEILNDREIGLSNRYANLGCYLSDNATELWLLFDEFQQVVEKWELDEHTLFAKTLADLQLKHSPIEGIKIVLCGSDELLKHMECNDVSNWRKIIKNRGIIVGPLDEIGFSHMIEEDKNFLETGLSFSPEAVKALYNYTGGIALYGKEICNAILSRISERKSLDQEYFLNRNTIYPYDISVATQMLIKTQGDEQRNNKIQVNGIYRIYDAVVKNLKEETDKLYLQYIAQWIREHPDSDHFPKKCFFIRDLKEKHNDIENSLIIASKRRILTELYDKSGKVYGYVFTTLFYYYAFLGINKKSCEQLEEDLFEVINDTQQNNSDHRDSSFTEMIDQMSLQEKKRNLLQFYQRIHEQDENYPRELRDLIGSNSETTNISAETYIDKNTGTSIGTQNNLHINTQIIANSFSTLLSNQKLETKELLSAMEHMPSIEAYLDENVTAAKVQNDYLEISKMNPEYELNEIIEKTNQIEAVTREAENRMLHDTVGAAVVSEQFGEISDQDWLDLLHLKNIEQLKHIKELPMEIITPLSFAVMLHSIFKRIQNQLDSNEGVDKELDYCPVAIMYCKVVEALLKIYHLPLYINTFPNETMKAGGHYFRDVQRRADGSYDNHRDLTIGSFSYQIVIPNGDNNINQRESFNSIVKRRKIYELTGTNNPEDNINREWEKHAKSIAKVLTIRNKSAHEAMLISENVFDWLIEILFDDNDDNNELMKIVEIVSSDEQSQGLN